MKVKWTLLVDDACGQVDGRHYARHIHVPHTPSIIRAIALLVNNKTARHLKSAGRFCCLSVGAPNVREITWRKHT